MAGTLMAHAGAEMIDRKALRALPAPESRGPAHKPVPHLALVEAIDHAARERGLQIEREAFALQREGDMIFGVVDFKALGAGPDLKVTNGDSGISLGFRGSNDRQMALQMVAGRRVFVCDNLMFSGDMIAMRRKHTRGLDLTSEVSEGLDRYLVHCGRLNDEVDRLRTFDIDDKMAKLRIFDAFAERVVPVTHFPKVARNYFEPDDAMTDCTPRSLWGLHNAFTRVVRGMRPAPAFAATARLGRFFGIGTAN